MFLRHCRILVFAQWGPWFAPPALGSVHLLLATWLLPFTDKRWQADGHSAVGHGPPLEAASGRKSQQFMLHVTLIAVGGEVQRTHPRCGCVEATATHRNPATADVVFCRKPMVPNSTSLGLAMVIPTRGHGALRHPL